MKCHILYMDWVPMDNGSTIGRHGSEGGTILLDEEYDDGARITLEDDCAIGPYSITCGIYGWTFHTRHFCEEQKARDDYDNMKVELERIVVMISMHDDSNL